MAVVPILVISCRVCAESKDSSLFVKNVKSKTGFDSICLQCSRDKVKLWRKENPEKKRAQEKRRSKDSLHNKHLRNNYNITREQYLVMFDEQNGSCKICNTHQLDLSKRLAVDHCHSTGRIRGLLCNNCNNVLGDAKDNISILKKAIDYLEENNG